MDHVVGRWRLPSLSGATGWLNAEPLGRSELEGRVVLIDFWTYTCINWLRTAPYLRAWWEAYRDDGLVVIGVHTPEFGFEQGVDRVREATIERGIEYPVAIDNDYAVWSAFANRYWPALYLVDESGTIRDYHPGEGRYGQTERVLQKLLGIEREATRPQGQGVEAAADWHHLRSPESYLGYDRGMHLASPGGARMDVSHAYEAPGRLRTNRWALEGRWTVGREHVTLDRAGGSIAFRFDARDVHLVLSRRGPAPISFRVRLDGEAPGASHGVDVDEHGHGLLEAGRMYQLVRQAGKVREGTAEIEFDEPGAEAYVFTFG